MNLETIQRGARELQTPCYVFDIDQFQARIAAIQALLGDRAEICYAMKANPFLVSAAEGMKIEVCSPGEFAICERSGIRPEQIVLSGVNKEGNEIHRVMKLYGDRMVYTVESPGQYELLANAAKACGITISVLLRMTAGNQFGMDQETISAIVADSKNHPEIHLLGLQFYSGTQKKKLSKIQKELKKLDDFLLELQETYGYQAKELEYGPGFYVPYFLDEEAEKMEEILGEFAAMLDALHFSGHVILEMGRYLAGCCGTYYTTVVDEKKNHKEYYGIADGGIHQLNYYGQMMAMKVPHYTQFDAQGELLARDGEKVPATIPADLNAQNPADGQANTLTDVTLCGSLCTVNDILVRSIGLSLPLCGSRIAFESCGAYSVTEGMALFLSRDLPRVYLYQNGAFTLQRDRMETNLWNFGV